MLIQCLFSAFEISEPWILEGPEISGHILLLEFTLIRDYCLQRCSIAAYQDLLVDLTEESM